MVLLKRKQKTEKEGQRNMQFYIEKQGNCTYAGKNRNPIGIRDLKWGVLINELCNICLKRLMKKKVRK